MSSNNPSSRGSDSQLTSMRALQARFEGASADELKAELKELVRVAPNLAAGMALAGLQTIGQIGLFVDDIPSGAPGDEIKRDAAGSSNSQSINATNWALHWNAQLIQSARLQVRLPDGICHRLQWWFNHQVVKAWRNERIIEGVDLGCD